MLACLAESCKRSTQLTHFLRKKANFTQKSAFFFVFVIVYYWYWFTLLYFSHSTSSFSNASILSAFNLPALSSFLCCLSQFSILYSSSRCFDGLRWLVSIKSITSWYRVNQRVSWSIISVLVLINLSFGEFWGSFSSLRFPVIHLFYGSSKHFQN